METTFPPVPAQSIEDLQEQLRKQIAALATQRQEEAKKFDEELAQRNKEAEAERAERIRKHEEAEKVHRERRAKELEEVEAKKREAIRIEQEVARKEKESSEAKDKHEAQLKWLEDEIARAEFAEEQHRKHLEGMKVKPEVPVSPTEINVEHPVAPVNLVVPGDGVEGTDGVSVGPTMSQHLRHILRQAQRPTQ